MYRDSTYRVVNLTNLVNECNRETHYKAYYTTNDGTGTYAYTVTTGSNTHETCKHTVADHGERRLAINYPCINKSSNTAYSSSHIGGHEDVRHTYRIVITRSSHSRTRVETEPSYPKTEDAEGTESKVVTRNSL